MISLLARFFMLPRPAQSPAPATKPLRKPRAKKKPATAPAKKAPARKKK
jgi:hypothetical protein